MIVEYDKKTDAKYIRFKEGKVARTEEFSEWLFLDYSENGDVLGIEILNSSQQQFGVSTIGGELLELFDLKLDIYITDKKKSSILKSLDVNIPYEKFVFEHDIL